MTLPLGTILNHHGTPITSADLSSEFEGATTGDRLGEWGLSASGPSASQMSIGGLRKRARNLERNNAVANGAIDSFVSNLVGTDISPTWNLDNEDQREELQQLWDDSQLEADFYGVSDFYGTQEIVCRGMVRDGECLARFHDLRPSYNMVVPLQVQLLEPDHLDVAYTDISQEGNEIRYGIEWKDGRRYKYWLYKDHPGEMFLTGTDLTRIAVDAEDMSHVFRPLRAGQARGFSRLAPIILKLHDIDQYDDAELVRKKVAALWGGFIYSDSPAVPTMPGQHGKKENGVQSVTLKAGTFPVLRDGMKIAFSESPDVGNNHFDYMKTQFRLVARGVGITYEQLTGDLENVNYTSLRAGLIEFRRLCETIIARTLIFQYCRPWINRWIYTAILNNCLKTIPVSEYLSHPITFHRVDWHLDGWDFTDPVKDRVAEKMDIRGGLDTRGSIVSKRGDNIDRVDRRNKAELAMADKLELIYDTYPSHTSNNGVLSKIEEKTILESTKTD